RSHSEDRYAARFLGNPAHGRIVRFARVVFHDAGRVDTASEAKDPCRLTERLEPESEGTHAFGLCPCELLAGDGLSLECAVEANAPLIRRDRAGGVGDERTHRDHRSFELERFAFRRAGRTAFDANVDWMCESFGSRTPDADLRFYLGS